MTKRQFQRSGFCMIDLIAVGGLALLTAIILPAIAAAQERANRVRCQSNLAMIGKGLLLYSTDNANRGTYPRTRYSPGDPLTQFTGVNCKGPFDKDKGPAMNDVSAAIYLLLREGEYNPRVFVCPSSLAAPLDPKKQPPLEVANFPSDKHLSYGFSNPYPDVEAIRRGYKWSGNVPDAEFVVAGDIGHGNKKALELRSDSPPPALRLGNSNNHGRAGQNLLFADGHCEWQPTPFVGVNQDNVYTAAAVKKDADGGFRQLNPAASVEGVQPKLALDTVILPYSTLPMRNENKQAAK